MGQAFRNLELVVMPVQVMFPNPQKLSKETKRVQDLQDTLRPLRYNQMNFAVFNQGSSIQLDKLPQQVGPQQMRSLKNLGAAYWKICLLTFLPIIGSSMSKITFHSVKCERIYA